MGVKKAASSSKFRWLLAAVAVMGVMNSGEARVDDAPVEELNWLHPPRSSASLLVPWSWSLGFGQGLGAWPEARSVGASDEAPGFSLPNLTLPSMNRMWPDPSASPTPTPVAAPYPTYSPSPTSTPYVSPTYSPSPTSTPDVSPTYPPYATVTPEVSPTSPPYATATPQVSPTSYPTSSPPTTVPSPTGSPAPTPECNNVWSPYTAIREGEMLAPVDQRGQAASSASPTPAPMPMDGTLACAVETAYDRDSVSNCRGTQYVNDGLTYVWRASPGGFQVGTHANGTPIIVSEARGLSATYKPPKGFIGRASVSCTIDDVALVPAGEDGWRDDGALYRSCSILVKGDKVKLHADYHTHILEADGKSTGGVGIQGWHDDGPAAGMTVTLTTTSGKITPSSVVLDGVGYGGAQVTAGTEGVVATITGTLNQETGTAKVVMHRLEVTGLPQMLTYDPESSLSERRAPVIRATIKSIPPIAKKLNAEVRIHTLKHGEELNKKLYYDLVPGPQTWQWSEFFMADEFEPTSEKSPNPGRGLYPYQITAEVTELDIAWLKSHGIIAEGDENLLGYYEYNRLRDSKASESLQTTWTEAKIGYNEAAARTELAYTFRIYNVRRPAPPKVCRLDIYDPDLNVVQSVPIATTEFKPVPQFASTFQVDKVIPFKPGSAGDYHFVVEAQQSDHIDEGKDAGKWALERNGGATAPPFVVFGGYSPGGNPKFTSGFLDTSWGRNGVAERLENNMGYSGNKPRNAPWWMPTLMGNRDYGGKGWTAKTVVGITGTGISPSQVAGQTMQYNAVWVYSGHGNAFGNNTAFGVYGGDKNSMQTDEYTPEEWTYISSYDGSIGTPGNDREDASISHMPRAFHGRKVLDPQAQGGWSLKSRSDGGTNKTTSSLLFCNLLVFAGCNTAVDPAPGTDTRSFSQGNSRADMPQMSVHYGARAAVGIVGVITRNQNVYFQNELFKWLSGPYSLDAARAKAEYYAESAVSPSPFVNGKKAVVWYRNSSDQGQMQVNADHAWWGDPSHQGPENYTGP